MDPIAIIVGVLLLGGSAAFVLRPFDKRQQHHTAKVVPLLDARRAREASLSALRDLDFDFRTGKVSADDYPALRAQLVVEAAKTMDEDERLEAMIRARKASPVSTKICSHCGKTLGAHAQFCPACGTPLSMECPACAKPVRQGDLFCRSCGRKLDLPAQAAA